VAATFTAFGVIHSVQPQGGVYWPWSLSGHGAMIAAQFVAAYLVLAVLLLALSRVNARAE